ncbi:MAG: HAD-superfamily hydrolase, subfamily [Dehalococcoidales bacterium]|nr:HAD-superfamily hydrolase, subfamily [Dehalococcoidales bacterium]
MTNHYRLLVTDIDGTLLGKNGTISPDDRTTLAKIQDSGMQVALSTGRVMLASLKIIKELSLDGYHIFCDGALVSNPENDDEVYAKPISQALLREAIEFSHLYDINLDLYSRNRYFIERETWATAIRRDFFGVEPTVVDFNQVWPEERIIKGALVLNSAEERAKAESFRLHFQDCFNFSLSRTPSYPEVDFINVVAQGVSKGEALLALSSYLNIPMSEVIAIGDGNNDVSLLSKAGLAIAMGNAPDELKAVADYVTLDVEHSGLSAAIKKLLR